MSGLWRIAEDGNRDYVNLLDEHGQQIAWQIDASTPSGSSRGSSCSPLPRATRPCDEPTLIPATARQRRSGCYDRHRLGGGWMPDPADRAGHGDGTGPSGSAPTAASPSSRWLSSS
jgi:hypothetical protein